MRSEVLGASTWLLRAGRAGRLWKPSPEACCHSRQEPELNRCRDHDADGEAVRVGPPTEHEGRHHSCHARSGPTPLPEGGSGRPIDKQTYDAAVAFWERHAAVRQE